VIPLDRNRYGAGCVVGEHHRNTKPSTRIFIAGVVRWVGAAPPTSKALANLPIEQCGFAHLRAITESGGLILGEAELAFSSEPKVAEALSMPTWGYGVPHILATRVAEDVG
jgi:hypothetical protein